MRNRIEAILDYLGSSFWFLPSAMTCAAGVLAFATVSLDSGETVRGWGWAYDGGAEGASTLLGAVAGSMVSLAGLVFSMTLVALSLTSSQFGPRLLRNFMRDRANQVVLGTFVATFVYCLLVLRTIRRGDESPFVPHLSVTLGVLMAVASVAVLIYFVHHVAMSIQADEVISRVSDDLFRGIEHLYPEEIGRGLPGDAARSAVPLLPEGFDRECRPVAARADGYVQLLDADNLVKLAAREDLLVRVACRPGDYVALGSPLAHVWPGDRVGEALEAELRAVFFVGDRRTEVQDVEFVVDQLVEIAARALSPGINDPFTAVACIDRLGSALIRLCARELPSPYRFVEGKFRVVAPAVTFGGIADAAFGQIRQFGRTSTTVTNRLLETIAAVADAAHRPEDLATLRRHADMILRGSREGLPEPEDRRVAEERYRTACRRLPGSDS